MMARMRCRQLKRIFLFALSLTSVILICILASYSILVCRSLASSKPLSPSQLVQNSKMEWNSDGFNGSDLDREFDFDVERDVLMFVQIPKTGSTEMDQHLVMKAEVGKRRDKCRLAQCPKCITTKMS